MDSKNTTSVKSRGIILCEDKLFVVKHIQTDFYALPGGNIKRKESPIECIKREIFEELGVVPEVGRLLYINQFEYLQNDNFLEFFFEIKNGKDYLDIEKLTGTHRNEIVEILWVGKNEKIKILPEKIYQDFNSGNLLDQDVRFIK